MEKKKPVKNTDIILDQIIFTLLIIVSHEKLFNQYFWLIKWLS
jgi:hypothetical protein